MNRKQMFILAFFSAMVLIFIAHTALAQGPKTSPKTATSAVSTAFTYQGQLKKNSSPYNGTCSFDFALYDAPTGSGEIGSDEQHSSVLVSNGLFTVQLNSTGLFGSTPFNGSARYLQVQVLCPGDVGWYVFTPRQELTAAPYAQTALALNYGTVMNGANSGGSGLEVDNSATAGNGLLAHNSAGLSGGSAYAAVHGVSDAPTDGFGVVGTSGSTSLGAGMGGFIGGSGTNGAGVVGYTGQSGLNTAGVRAQYAGSGVGTALEINGGAIRVTGAGYNTTTAVFIHTVTHANICDTNNRYATAINNPMTTGDPNAFIFVTPWGWDAYPHNNSPALAVTYDWTGSMCGTAGRWLIQSSVPLSLDPDSDHIQVLVIKQ